MAAQDYEQVTYNSPAGAQMGKSATELIAFHGATPTDQPAFAATVSVEGTTGGVGFSSSGHFSNAVTLLNRIQAILVEKGLMAAS